MATITTMPSDMCRLTISLMRVVPEPKKEHDCTVCSSLEHSFISASLRSLNSNFLFGNILLPHSCVCPNSSKHCGFCCKTLILTVPAGLFLFAALKNTNRASGGKKKKKNCMNNIRYGVLFPGSSGCYRGSHPLDLFSPSGMTRRPASPLRMTWHFGGKLN